jgi:hypothetical protein
MFHRHRSVTGFDRVPPVGKWSEMPGQRRKKLSPKQFIAKYGPGIKSGRLSDALPEFLQHYLAIQADKVPAPFRHASHSEVLETYRSPVPWSELEKTNIGELLQRTGRPAAPWIPSDELRDSWIVSLLNEAARANEPEAFTALLLELLTTIGVRVPDGVLAAWPKTLGAPTKVQTGKIYECWVRLGRPSLHKKTLAEEFFGKGFRTAAPLERRKKIDLCRRAVERAKKAAD